MVSFASFAMTYGSLVLLSTGRSVPEVEVSIAHNASIAPQVLIAETVSMPMISFGTFLMTTAGCSPQFAIEQWLRLGGRSLEMSWAYFSQRTTAKAIEAVGIPRHELFLISKVEEVVGFEATLAQVEIDLLEAKVDYFDLLLIDFPCPNMITDWPDHCGPAAKQLRLDTWRALEQAKASGKARAIGLSNYNEEQIQELIDAGFHPAVNERQWHLGCHNDTLLQYMDSVGVRMMAWAPLGGPSTEIQTDCQTVPLTDPRLKFVAERYHTSTAQVALQWSMSKGVLPISGSCDHEHVKSDLNVFDFQLSAKDIAYLDSLKAQPTVAEVKDMLGIEPGMGSAVFMNKLIFAALGLVVVSVLIGASVFLHHRLSRTPVDDREFWLLADDA